jgi:16S rRNA (cytosine967-C5)-methyltransferase
MNPRAVAAKVIADVVGSNIQLNDALLRQSDALTHSADQPLLQELSYGVLRWWFPLRETALAFLKAPPKRKDFDVFCLLLVGLYQLQHTRIPPHAAVSETVAAVRQLNKAWADKLLNAVLRRYLRQSEEGEGIGSLSLQALSLQARYAHPSWLLEKLQTAWPEFWTDIVTANNERPPMTLRANRQQITGEDYLKQLHGKGIQAEAAPYVPDGILLAHPTSVENLPGFHQGLVSVQDSAAQLAAGLLQTEAGQRVLDVCAAPGGKTAHLLETTTQLSQMVALDVDPHRLQRVEDNLRRLKLNATLIRGDATKPQSWWDGVLFDRILLDAPCSATGVIRRHPDIKVLRQAKDITRIAQLQRQILDAVWSLLKPGGMLLYATCSVLPEENEKQMALFVERNNNACYQSISAPWGHKRPYGRQIFPGENHMDGFYYACMVKSAENNL